jgi:8-oxo-dGTP diphosphatase
LAARGSSRPRVRVAAVIVVEGKILLVRQRRTGRPYYLLPGGGVDAGETIGEALRREVLEETGLECVPVRPLFISDTIEPEGSRHVVNITFLAAVTGGELLPLPHDPSIEGIDLVAPESLAGIDLRPPMAEALKRAADAGFDIAASYLGPLWVSEDGAL